jgi:hypothetical protein
MSSSVQEVLIFGLEASAVRRAGDGYLHERLVFVRALYSAHVNRSWEWFVG